MTLVIKQEILPMDYISFYARYFLEIHAEDQIIDLGNFSSFEEASLAKLNYIN